MRTRHLLGMTGLLAALLSGCGGGGDDGPPASQPDPNRVGAGWIKIDETSATESSSAGIWGTAFVSPNHWRCCTGKASDTGVTVTWINSTTGVSDNARQFPRYVPFFFQYVLLGTQDWSATIPLVVGDNVITATATDPGGNLGRATITVRRLPDTKPPVVSANSPANGAIDVGTRSGFSVTFSEPMDSASISVSTIVLKDNLLNAVAGVVTYADRIATFTPLMNLQGMTTFTATVTTNVKDLAGNPISAEFTWNFTTGSSPDETAPTVTSTSPANGAACVPIESALSTTFSEPVIAASVNVQTFVLQDSANNSVVGSVALGFDGRANFHPNAPLASAATYTGTITTGLTDLSGNRLAADYAWSFVTQAAGTGAWNSTSMIGAPSPRSGHSLVWTGTEMIVWGGPGQSTESTGNGARYNPATDTWLPVSNVGVPEARSGHVALWTGSRMIVWGGVRPGAFLNSGAIYDPATDSWTSMTISGAPSPRQSATAVWTGSEMIVWGGTGSGGGTAADGARYNPATNSWLPVTSSGAPAARYGHTAVWTGSAMIVWGGAGPVAGATGGIYSPSSNTWSAISTAGAPSSRGSHVAVWTGTEMIVWGGYDGTSPLSTGGRFNPGSNFWLPMASACEPLARYGHIGVWSGFELIIWGGGLANGPHFAVGGRYNPNTDSWQATPIAGAPSARQGHKGVWTGSELLVWGGSDVLAMSLNSGGRYRP